MNKKIVKYTRGRLKKYEKPYVSTPLTGNPRLGGPVAPRGTVLGRTAIGVDL